MQGKRWLNKLTQTVEELFGKIFHPKWTSVSACFVQAHGVVQSLFELSLHNLSADGQYQVSIMKYV